MIFSKFIIETDEELNKVLIIGRCTYHKQLAYDINNVISGGIWMYIDDKTIQFSGESYDFGRANVNDIKECIKNGHVYTSYICRGSC